MDSNTTSAEAEKSALRLHKFVLGANNDMMIVLRRRCCGGCFKLRLGQSVDDSWCQWHKTGMLVIIIIIVIIVIIIHTFLYRPNVVTSEAVAEQVRSCQSLSVIMSQVKQVSFKPRFKNYHWRTLRYRPRKWVWDSWCRVTEAYASKSVLLEGYASNGVLDELVHASRVLALTKTAVYLFDISEIFLFNCW